MASDIRGTTGGDIGNARPENKDLRKGASLGGPASEPNPGLAVGEPSRDSRRKELIDRLNASGEIRDLPAGSSKTSHEIERLSALRLAADDFSARLEKVHCPPYSPTENVDGKTTREIFSAFSNQLNALQDCLDDTSQSQIAFAEDLQQEIVALSEQVKALEGREDLRPTVFDEIGQTILVLTISLAVGAVIGGPTLAYLQHATLSSKLAEGAIGGLAGGIGSEVIRQINSTGR